jgi:hypothetical protein
MMLNDADYVVSAKGMGGKRVLHFRRVATRYDETNSAFLAFRHYYRDLFMA